MILFEELEGIPTPTKLEKIKEFYRLIFTEVDLEKFDRRINAAEKLFIILAISEDEIIGFKIGYQIDASKFYSWIGGVKKEFRKQGIADELMKRQHDWCQRTGFQTVQTKTRNWFKPMLILNLKNGFDIVELHRDKESKIKIVLEKSL